MAVCSIFTQSRRHPTDLKLVFSAEALYLVFGGLLLLTIFPTEAFGLIEERKWQKLPIANAYCGDGTPYHIFLSEGARDKLALGFMGGGACWDYRSCYGMPPLTILTPLPFMLHSTGIFSAKRGSLRDYTHLFLPYCTGDVFIGRHVAHYKGRATNHNGNSNVAVTIKHIFKILPELRHLKSLVVHGSSGGAIGALFQLNLLEREFGNAEQKVLLADSPGLHFGPNFWGKFSTEMKADFARAFAEISLPFDPETGDVAELMDDLCQNFPDWRIGFLQFDKDIVMSRIFGAVDPGMHLRNVYDRNGIWQTLVGAKMDNCAAWIARGYGHTVLLTTPTIFLARDGIRADQFVRELVDTHFPLRSVPRLAPPNPFKEETSPWMRP
jgi:hypothetical protein